MAEASTEQRTSWHALPTDEVLDHLDSSSDGLEDATAKERLRETGPNRLEDSGGRPWWRRLLDQFNNILIIILLIAGITAGILGQWVDAAAIFAVVLINAAIGFIQEGKAEKALQSIRSMLSPEATVRRGGNRKTIPAEELVPGDVVLLESGDGVPADLRLLSARRCRMEEAALTGESEPVGKQTDAQPEDADLADRSSMAYASTLCVHGTCEGVVVATAMDTEIGHISRLIESVDTTQTPLQQQLDQFAKVLAGGILALAAAMGAFGVLVHERGIQDMFMAGVGLAVAAIPQGLPAIVTITLALGVQAMARRNAIIRQLPAVETLGSVSTIFTDKTGTLTRNEMTVNAIAMADNDFHVSGVGFTPEGRFSRGRNADEDGTPVEPENEDLLGRLLTAGVLCNDAALRQQDDTWTIDGDPTEGALLVVAAKAGLAPDDVRQEYCRVDDIPFESERKYMATLDEPVDGGDPVIHVKGAPDVLLDMCDRAVGGDNNGELDRDRWHERIEDLSSGGLRVLALASKPADTADTLEEADVESGLTLLGLVGIMDPPRDSAVSSVRECQDAGIRVKMVTGDHALTAQAVATEIGIAGTGGTLTGHDIEEASDEELRDRVLDINVFARAAPEHKLRLVEAIQDHKQVCAMTGDGVNDAPALKRADIGVAMGVQGSEASKEAAEMVLADDNFSTIVAAVREGRRVYANIRKTITFLLPTNGAESLAIMIAILAGTLLPITPVQILWVNMVTAVTLGLALAFEPAEPDIMQQPPRDPKEPILSLFLLWRVLFVSVLLVAPVYGLFLWLQQWQGASVELARTAAVNMLVIGEVVYLLNTRRPLASALSWNGLFGSRRVWLAIGLVLLIQLLWTYTGPMQWLFASDALSLAHWGLIWLAGGIIFLMVEIEKAILRAMKTSKSESVTSAAARRAD
ncbi:potassium and/or sodium efflux P-type ATPase [Marinobacter daqiaonensis]|uniref:Potassium and/or sodium efflux P-type ATPase n=1 Tax=Marinobacter daqiaonensis TaxID=650891 RepID=A0A1I6HTR5_9GAMM|nr:cation-transporting P-type ATPase [Marinobacter daqiaonensis]SFR57640.1 potassium and/or sodium efflux P-type ATPase [Marinobacter daqiaonensis]